MLTVPSSLLAQVQEQGERSISEFVQEPTEELVEEPAEVIVTLPDSHQMAEAVATPEYRHQALLDLAVAANVLSRARNKTEFEVEVDHAVLAQSFLDDRAWLQMLVDRYGWMQPRSLVLDPAAWLVREELQQHDLEDSVVVFRGHAHKTVLLYQVFQRARERLAVANLPNLLLEVEADTISIWDAFLQLTRTQESTDASWKVVEDALFPGRQLPSAVVLDENSQEHEAVSEEMVIGDASHEAVIEDIPLAMSKLVSSTVTADLPDSRGLKQLRLTLLEKMPLLNIEEDSHVRDQVRKSLYLTSIVDGLHEERYFEFIQGLLSITSSLLEMPVNSGETISLVSWLVTELPAISVHYAVDFARVDPRFNTTMAACYDVLLKIASSYEPAADDLAAGEHVGEDSANSGTTVADATIDDSVGSDPVVGDSVAQAPVADDPDIFVSDIEVSRGLLAKAAAQLSLLIPDMGYYFETPVRARIVEEIDICISIGASLDDDGASAMTRRQFDACMETMLQLAEEETRLAELSGNMDGPFSTDSLRRELNVTPWQRINYVIGFLHDRYSVDCQPPVEPLPNPLEWAVLATTMTWFAQNSPEFVNTLENEARVTKMRSIGEQLVLGLSEQSACFANAGPGVNDPVSRAMTDYELALRELDLGIEQAEADFRTERLSTGADISLELDASQRTSYRPDDLPIEPCNSQAVCDMSGSLSTTRALIGLFPEELLVAEQAGMGRIEICYRNMEWVRRRSQLVRADDENVANYFGHLGFDLVGRYIENDEISDIFGFRFTSPEEYHYLFAQTSEDVLNDSCPVEWVGSKIVTPLREDRGGIVPNRLTYLAASRSLPSRLLQNNWDKGAEWRDWFVTGIGVSKLEVPEAPEIMIPLNQHLQSLYQAEQTDIYQRVMLANARNSEGDDVSLFDEMSQVSIAKALIRMQVMLFYSESMFNSDKIRTAIAGDGGLLEGRTLRRFREDNIALTSVNRIALERLNKLREVWLEQPEAVRQQGSVPTSLMHALSRIDILYREFYTSHPEPLQEIEVTARPRDQVWQEN
ncbi:MAG: hypothetical protein GY732_00555 [Gammaproteobacteria bacterium]|nr:hypothetical protein [Gammaproteobacteria bacterium]